MCEIPFHSDSKAIVGFALNFPENPEPSFNGNLLGPSRRRRRPSRCLSVRGCLTNQSYSEFFSPFNDWLTGVGTTRRGRAMRFPLLL